AHYKQTGENLGKFATEQQAEEYAQRLHNRQARFYQPTGASGVTPTTNAQPDRVYMGTGPDGVPIYANLSDQKPSPDLVLNADGTRTPAGESRQHGGPAPQQPAAQPDATRQPLLGEPGYTGGSPGAIKGTGTVDKTTTSPTAQGNPPP